MSHKARFRVGRVAASASLSLPGPAPARACCPLPRLVQPPADQFAFPKPIAAAVEAVTLPGGVEFNGPLTSRQRIAAGVAIVSHAIADRDVSRVFARQGASIKFLVNPADQMGTHGAYRMIPTGTPV